MPDRDALITDNLGLVHSCARRFVHRGIDYDDLYQAGCVGLIKAADGFDNSRGIMFSTYAIPAILGEIKRMFRDGGSVKVSRALKTLSAKALHAKESLEKNYGREATVGEIALELGVSPEEISEALCAARPVMSLTYEDEDGVNELPIADAEYEDEINDRLYVDEMLGRLECTERRIIELRYYSAMTQSETAKVLNLSQVQVSRKEKRILALLRGEEK